MVDPVSVAPGSDSLKAFSNDLASRRYRPERTGRLIFREVTPLGKLGEAEGPAGLRLRVMTNRQFLVRTIFSFRPKINNLGERKEKYD